MTGQNSRTVVAPDGNIYYPHGHSLYSNDFSVASQRARELFFHEMTHVYQHQAWVNVRREAAKLFLDNNGNYSASYPYQFQAGRPFTSYNIEQQAEIVRDYYRMTSGPGATPVPGSPSIPDYSRILPFGIGQGR